MTARQSNSPESVNSAASDSTAPQTVLEYLREQRRTTIDETALACEIERSEAEHCIAELDRDGLVRTKTRLHDVHVVDETVEIAYLTDGGHGMVQRLIDKGAAYRTIDLTESELYGALSNGRRRNIIKLVAALTGGNDQAYVTAGTLADSLTLHVDGVPVDTEPGRDIRHQHYVSIVQVHGPLLDDLGVVEYYERVKKFQATEQAIQVAELLTEIDARCEDDDE